MIGGGWFDEQCGATTKKLLKKTTKKNKKKNNNICMVFVWKSVFFFLLNHDLFCDLGQCYCVNVIFFTFTFLFLNMTVILFLVGWSVSRFVIIPESNWIEKRKKNSGTLLFGKYSIFFFVCAFLSFVSFDKFWLPSQPTMFF